MLREDFIEAGPLETDAPGKFAHAAAQAVADREGIGAEDRGFRLIMNVGPDALNSVPHLHLHVLGGRSMTWPPG